MANICFNSITSAGLSICVFLGTFNDVQSTLLVALVLSSISVSPLKLENHVAM